MYRKESEGWFKHIDFILIDMICLQIAFCLAYVLKGLGINPYANLVYRNMAIVLELADLATMFMLDTLHHVTQRGYYREMIATIGNVAAVGLLGIAYLFVIQEGTAYSRLTFGITLVLYLVLSYGARLVWKRVLASGKWDTNSRSLLIVTTSDEAKKVVERVRTNNYGKFVLSGLVLVDKDMAGQSIAGVKVVANSDDAPMYVCQQWIDEVLIVVPDTQPYPDKLISQLKQTGVTLHLKLSKIAAVDDRPQFVENIGSYTVLTTSLNYASAKQLLFKRVMDIAGGLVGCLLTGIIFIFVAPIIYISSPGPIFFSQERIGKNGKKFKIYKFRSMYMDAEARKAELMKQNRVADGKMFKLDFDPRVIGNKILPDGTKKTGIGNFIRVTSLDEFPQFFNVLKGDMSIVGPRPLLVSYLPWYTEEEHHRHDVRPGLTGLAQVNGRNAIKLWESVFAYDLKYVSNITWIGDLKIILSTISKVFKRSDVVVPTGEGGSGRLDVERRNRQNNVTTR
mgnify:CR=1 FL=1